MTYQTKLIYEITSQLTQYRSLHLKTQFVLQKINGFQQLRDQIAVLPITVLLQLVCLDCQALNAELKRRSQLMRDRLVKTMIDDNREINRRCV